MTTSRRPEDDDAASTAIDADELPSRRADVPPDGEVSDAAWIERNSPTAESLRRMTRKNRPPQAWYEADAERPF